MDPNLDLLRGKQSLMREMRKTRNNAGDIVTRQDIFLFIFNVHIEIKYLIYQKTLIRTFHTIFFLLQNNFCEYTTKELKLKG